MGLIFESPWMDYAVAGIALFLVFYLYWAHKFSYWKRRGIPYIKPIPIFGNMKDRVLARKPLGVILQEFYNQLEGKPFGGLYQMTEPLLFIRDPELIKIIMVKDFNSFQERGMLVDEERNPLSAHLFSLDGPRWRKLRVKLTPTFTSGKMRMMYRLMHECALELRDCLEDAANKGEIVEMKDVVGKFTTDVIGTCAFGLQFNSMKNPDSEFRRMGKAIFQPSWIVGLRHQLNTAFPWMSKIFHLHFPEKHVSDFFIKAVKETVDYREKNNVKRNDFMQLLIELKNKAQLLDDYEKGEEKMNTAQANGTHKSVKDMTDIELTDHLLAAQAFVFFVAGYETSATTIGFALHELAVNPDVQTKLRDEIHSVIRENGGEITYDTLQKMNYLDKVVAETLRKYPPLPGLARQCTAPFTIPGTNITIEKGCRISIPVYALQRDPKYFPDPEAFDPERFNEENKSKRPHYAYMPFGEGPRNCIGMRFGQLQSKLGLAVLLRDFEFSTCQKTKIHTVLDSKTIFTASVGGNWLRVTKCRAE